MAEVEQLWSPEKVAEFFDVSVRQVTERYAYYPNFPKAIRLPAPKGQGVMRWRKSSIMEWLDKQEAA